MRTHPLKIGLDFDNTIVCYDEAIAELADKKLRLPTDLPRTKLDLRDYLRAAGREQEWTAFQGELYGPGMANARPFEGAIETMQALVEAGHQLTIVSHRSRRPYAGTPHDLHESAREWVSQRLQTAGLFLGEGETTEDNSSVSFLETREAKVARIAELGLHLFVDDLPEVLGAPNFPRVTVGVLFVPNSDIICEQKEYIISAWKELPQIIDRLQ